MSKRIETFADLIAPFDEETFFRDYHKKQYLHIPAPDPDKLSDVMSWDKLSDILNMSGVWSSNTLKLFLDTEPVPVQRYCRPIEDRDKRMSQQPISELVKDWLRQGASLVCNGVDSLQPGIRSAANALERRLGGRMQSNLYCSWAQRKAFPPHFDTHEVFALHVEGEKVWRIFEGRVENPTAGPRFQQMPQEEKDALRGEQIDEITMRPGDLLYIPRGLFHDALASSDGCVHLSFGITHVLGGDILTVLFEQALADAAFRTDRPLPDEGEAAFEAWLEDLMDRVVTLGRTRGFKDAVSAMKPADTIHRGGYDLPGEIIGTSSGEKYGLAAPNVSVTARDGQPVLRFGNKGVPVPPGMAEPLRWIVKRQVFYTSDFDAAFPDMPEEARGQLVTDLLSMQVLAKAA